MPPSTEPACLFQFPESDLGIFVMNLETKLVTKLTNLLNNGTEERSPAWSPDSTRIAIMKRRAVAPTTFNIWVLHFDPTEDPPRVTENQLTDNTLGHLSPAWSPSGEKIVFARNSPVDQIFVINANGTNQQCADGTNTQECPLTGPAPAPAGALLGQNGGAKWGRIAVGRDPQ